MKLFIDTALVEEIKEAQSWGIIDGVTTNPSLVAQTGKKFLPVVKEILKLVKGPVSIEAVSDDADGMIKEAKAIAKLGRNAVVKIPMTSEGMKAVRELSRLKIKTNVTLVFGVNQALLAAKAGATYVSPFVGRLDDIGEDGMLLIEEIVRVFRNYNFQTQVLTASVRHTEHVRRAALVGSDVATVPFKILKELFNHHLTDKGIKKFMADWEKVPK